MSAWATEDLANALPAANEATSTAPTRTPQEHGWAEKQNYNYAVYNKSNKEIADQRAASKQTALGGDTDHVAIRESASELPDSQLAGDAVGGLQPGDWSSNAAVYEWQEEFGDVGPRFPELEQQLFGSEFHVKMGLDFKNIAEISVYQEGVVRIQPVLSFAEAGLHPVMLDNIKLAGYRVPTPIQAYTMPAVHQGYDLVACAQTGSGKTAAFLIPILSKLMGKAKKLAAPRPNPATFIPGVSQAVRAEPLLLIVCPTRELATQIFDETRRFCYRTMLRPCCIYGGSPIPEQLNQLAKGCDVLIATPGRLCDFIDRPHILSLNRLRYMVIDEADEMVGADWDQELKKIMSGGATFNKAARDLANHHLAMDHCKIRVGRAGSTHKNIKQDIVWVESSQKKKALIDLLMSLPPARTMIFVNSKRGCDEVDDYLFNLNMPCTSIHSDRTQREREDSIRSFRTARCPILIATPVAARGLDIANVVHVINYDLPSNSHGGIEEYMHRIGRTGRIGNHGLATSFYNERDSDLGEMLVKTLLETNQEIPDFLTDLIPEGFVPGQGDVSTLKFEMDSDDEAEAGGDTSADAAGGGAWGATTGATGGGDAWGANTGATGGDAWGATSGGGWGA
ncbi:putative ATP-dependent RNA helicase ded1 [Glarea lozoyensis 74030]|uniref:RNA helicase n=1 Tax=Glarea lozoyensis (strain ATCC 74030 / MF5533) TaxID=1104152 RepID=H0EVK3_GLAL7|nr:putative ATP-dependent RNA helicase ded1 [Glarea lozoyensis 74030]